MTELGYSFSLTAIAVRAHAKLKPAALGQGKRHAKSRVSTRGIAWADLYHAHRGPPASQVLDDVREPTLWGSEAHLTHRVLSLNVTRVIDVKADGYCSHI
jgi:hypothetical protein